MSKKQAIPTYFKTDEDLNRFAAAVKQTLDSITGQARNAVKLEPLPATATNAEIIERLNAIAERIQ